jgi:hypothetical protein
VSVIFSLVVLGILVLLVLLCLRLLEVCDRIGMAVFQTVTSTSSLFRLSWFSSSGNASR